MMSYNKEIQELKHRLLMVEDDLKCIVKFIKDSKLELKFENPTDEAERCWQHFVNIEIACNLESNECLDWELFDKKQDTMPEIKKIGQQSADFFGYLESIFRPVRSIKQFKMRAEGMSDIFCFINEVGKHPNGILEYKIESQGGIPDAIITFDSALSKDEIRLVLEKIRDGHVMYDTIAYIEEYTGERI